MRAGRIGASHATRAQADRAGVLRQQATEARHKTWLDRGTVRSLRACQHFRLVASPLDVLGATLTATVTAAGIDNLPCDLSAHIAERGGTTGPELLPAWIGAIEDADGGFARYILTVRPWIALLAHTRQSRVWVEKPLTPAPLTGLRARRRADWRRGHKNVVLSALPLRQKPQQVNRLSLA